MQGEDFGGGSPSTAKTNLFEVVYQSLRLARSNFMTFEETNSRGEQVPSVCRTHLPWFKKFGFTSGHCTWAPLCPNTLAFRGAEMSAGVSNVLSSRRRRGSCLKYWIVASVFDVANPTNDEPALKSCDWQFFLGVCMTNASGNSTLGLYFGNLLGVSGVRTSEETSPE